VAGAVDQPALVAAGQFLLGMPDDQHGAVKVRPFLPVRRCHHKVSAFSIFSYRKDAKDAKGGRKGSE
jgi:hypothetical protein